MKATRKRGFGAWVRCFAVALISLLILGDVVKQPDPHLAWACLLMLAIAIASLDRPNG